MELYKTVKELRESWKIMNDLVERPLATAIWVLKKDDPAIVEALKNKTEVFYKGVPNSTG